MADAVHLALSQKAHGAYNLTAEGGAVASQIAEELVAEARYDMVICDRSVLDNYVYLLLAEGSQPDLETLVDHWMGTYDLLIHAPVIELPSADGVRADNPAFQLAVEERLVEEVARRGLPCLELSRGQRDEWIEEVEEVVVGQELADKVELTQLRLRAGLLDLEFDEATGHYRFGEIDWQEFIEVIKGNGPCNKQRMAKRRTAHDDGAWVREAAQAYAAKRAASRSAA